MVLEMHLLRQSCTKSRQQETEPATVDSATLRSLEVVSDEGASATPLRSRPGIRAGSWRAGLRAMGRVAWLGGEVCLALLDFIINVVFRPKVPLARARAVWLQQTCRTALRILNVEVRTEGTIPSKGILASSHLSYLDVLVISAITPTIFVSHRRFKYWPLFGWFASMGGTLFVRPSKRTEMARLHREMTYALEGGNLIALFPDRERATDGEELSFKPALLAPATRLGLPLSASAIGYAVPGPEGAVATLLPHAPRWTTLLAGPAFSCTVYFTGIEAERSDRKELALHLQHRASDLRASALQTVG